MEYVCRSYHRGGKAICGSHRIHEEVIDQQVTEQLAEQKLSWEHEQLVLSCLRRERIRRCREYKDRLLSCGRKSQKTKKKSTNYCP